MNKARYSEEIIELLGRLLVPRDKDWALNLHNALKLKGVNIDSKTIQGWNSKGIPDLTRELFEIKAPKKVKIALSASPQAQKEGDRSSSGPAQGVLSEALKTPKNASGVGAPTQQTDISFLAQFPDPISSIDDAKIQIVKIKMDLLRLYGEYSDAQGQIKAHQKDLIIMVDRLGIQLERLENSKAIQDARQRQEALKKVDKHLESKSKDKSAGMDQRAYLGANKPGAQRK